MHTSYRTTLAPETPFPLPCGRVIVCRIPHNSKIPNAQASPTFDAPHTEPEAVNEPLSPPPHGGFDEVPFERLYEEHMDVLVTVAVRKFQVPVGDAEGLAHDVLLGYLRRKDEVRDLHKWLIGAICNASRYYWRQRGRNIEQLDTDSAAMRPDPASLNILDTLPARIAAGEVLAGLRPRYQEILRLRYFEGYSIKEIAEHLGVTAKYTQKLITKCLHRAEKFFDSGGGKKK